MDPARPRQNSPVTHDAGCAGRSPSGPEVLRLRPSIRPTFSVSWWLRTPRPGTTRTHRAVGAVGVTRQVPGAGRHVQHLPEGSVALTALDRTCPPPLKDPGVRRDPRPPGAHRRGGRVPDPAQLLPGVSLFARPSAPGLRSAPRRLKEHPGRLRHPGRRPDDRGQYPADVDVAGPLLPPLHRESARSRRRAARTLRRP